MSWFYGKPCEKAGEGDDWHRVMVAHGQHGVSLFLTICKPEATRKPIFALDDRY